PGQAGSTRGGAMRFAYCALRAGRFRFLILHRSGPTSGDTRCGSRGQRYNERCRRWYWCCLTPEVLEIRRETRYESSNLWFKQIYKRGTITAHIELVGFDDFTVRGEMKYLLVDLIAYGGQWVSLYIQCRREALRKVTGYRISGVWFVI